VRVFVYIYQQQDEDEGVVDQEAIQRLMEMGFSEDDILNALESCGHDFEEATAWLLGDRGVSKLVYCVYLMLDTHIY
jgi:uncharacterized UBP type Zn finger protein